MYYLLSLLLCILCISIRISISIVSFELRHVKLRYSPPNDIRVVPILSNDLVCSITIERKKNVTIISLIKKLPRIFYVMVINTRDGFYFGQASFSLILYVGNL